MIDLALGGIDMDHDKIFALDIGTRKIIGLVMQKKENLYEVLDAEMIEHQTRAMLDGQIHDVEAVAEAILTIKKRLEERLDMSLSSAAVAAAGRSLKTAHGYAGRTNALLNEINRDEVRALEIEAVQNAQHLAAREELSNASTSTYFCVGYSVISYSLEDQQIGNLLGQMGSSFSVEVIATFLPRVVVDSLLSSLKRAGLEVYSMTLEPIAAISLAIPANMRLLNLALVDIGAGTSDIAIVKNGGIYAYAMVPFGGDEISEHLASSYLLDFNSADFLKCQVSTHEEVQIKDILDNILHLNADEIKAQMEPMVRDLAREIASNILQFNGKATDAVLCVGGGSLTPNLGQYLAEALEIPRNRVGIRGRESAAQIKGDFICLQGPQAVTPLGIAFHSFDKPPVPLLNVTVNGRDLAIWNVGEMNVADALLGSGTSLSNAYGKPGMGKTLEINGYLKIFKGEMGTAPMIRVNGKEANLDISIIDGDQIEFTKGEDGQDARVSLAEIDPGRIGYIFINGEKIELKPMLTVNDKAWDAGTEIPDRAQVEIRRLSQLRQILRRLGLSENLLQEQTYYYYMNDQPLMGKWTAVSVKVDGKPGELDQMVHFGSYIEYRLDREKPRITDFVPLPRKDDFTVTVNGAQVTLQGKSYRLKRNGDSVGAEAEIFSGDRIDVNMEQSQVILSDIFQLVEIEKRTQGILRIRVNGEEAGYTTPLANNSEVTLDWE
jgi:cell division protein FtsA